MASGHSGHPSGERIWKQLKKTIVPGNYIKLSEQESLYKELKLHFNDFIACLNQIYPDMSKEDIYFCILSALKYKSRTIVYCMKTPAGALRTRKSRLKKIWRKKPSDHLQ